MIAAMDTDDLVDLANGGFPGLLLSELLTLVNEVMDRLPTPAGKMDLWEVACQAFNNASVLAGRSSSIQKLNQLGESLDRFHALLSEVSKQNTNQQKTLMDYIQHTESRQALVKELLECATRSPLTESVHFVPRPR